MLTSLFIANNNLLSLYFLIYVGFYATKIEKQNLLRPKSVTLFKLDSFQNSSFYKTIHNPLSKGAAFLSKGIEMLSNSA